VQKIAAWSTASASSKCSWSLESYSGKVAESRYRTSRSRYSYSSLEHQGETVDRELLRLRLWPEDTFVDFGQSMSTAVTKLRQALGMTRTIRGLLRRFHAADTDSLLP
jgi:hypothetical protein